MMKATLVVLAAVVLLVGGAAAGYLMAPRVEIAERSPQSFIDAIDGELPVPPGVTRIDERRFGRGMSGHEGPGGRALYAAHAVKGLALEIGSENPYRICSYYADYLAAALERCGARLSSEGGVGPRRLVLQLEEPPRRNQVYEKAGADSWYAAGKWAGDGTYIEVTGELYCLKDGRLLAAREPLPPEPWQRVLLVRIEAQAYGFTEPGHWPSMNRE